MEHSWRAAKSAVEDALVRRFVRTGLGIDIGSSSIKIVQLSFRDSVPRIETFGEIDLGSYDGVEAGRVTHLSPPKLGGAVQDLLHEIEAGARFGGVSIPFSSAFISLIETPKRDSEQMRRIMPVEAKKYIPVGAENVVLDWVVIPEDDAPRALERMGEARPVRATNQHLLLAALKHEVAERFEDISREMHIRMRFFEIEMFSAARSLGPTTGPTLIVDLGASATRAYIVNEHRIMLGAHHIGVGGEALTESLAASLQSDFATAERVKHTSGLHHAAAITTEEFEKIHRGLSPILSTLIAELLRTVSAYNAEHHRSISCIVLVGGGARMPGLLEHMRASLGLETKLANPFAQIHQPMVLEDVLAREGPKYAIAMGLALRANPRRALLA